MNRFRASIAAAFALATAAAAAPPLAAQGVNPAVQKGSMSRAKGASTATVIVHEFADFQCAHCAQFATEIYPRIDSAFIKTGKVQWVFVNVPMPTHGAAWIAHEAAVCAGAIADRFWAMHDRLYQRQAQWASAPDPAAFMTRLAAEVGVPALQFESCVARDWMAPLLAEDLLFAGSVRVNGTPAFIIDRQQSLMGVKSFEEWKMLLEKAIAAKSKR